MIDGKKVIAVVPARAGSKRLTNKNIRELNGVPLIGWTLKAAQESQYIDQILVTTDSVEIRDIVNRFGDYVPELRPDCLSKDDSSTTDVIDYVLNKFCTSDDIIVLLQPTSPLRTEQHIDEALELYSKSSADAVISVTECDHNPAWSNTLPHNGSMKKFISRNDNKRSQDLEKYFRLNGALYVFSRESFFSYNQIPYEGNSYAYIMGNRSSIDIDTLFDFKLAEFFMMES
ncbi:cytidylyltransferase domain-containing protein [Vibrio sp. 1S139]|uniref:acylneuraminate cytidylyltransferase family protein n=1 Tax=Vibrio sp. 1S139 TaxID=3230006 RepID=UPI00352F1B51